jgi:hypothetical protein
MMDCESRCARVISGEQPRCGEDVGRVLTVLLSVGLTRIGASRHAGPQRFASEASTTSLRANCDLGGDQHADMMSVSMRPTLRFVEYQIDRE